ncbi:MAG: diguanylate cyclase [Burkholderiales bacterium]
MQVPSGSPIPDDATLRELVLRFPLAVALVDGAGRIALSNGRFEDAAGSRDDLDLFGPLLRAPDGVWHPIRLVRRGGRPLEARAQAVRIRDCTLLVVNDPGEEAPMPELEVLHARIAELERQGATDPLTGAWNRLHLDRVIAHEIDRSLAFRQPLSLVLLDVDHFKRVNDALGHLGGDEVLRRLVEAVRAAIRASDLLFRWGGEEFVVLAASNGYRSAATLAEKLRERVSRHDFGQAGKVTVSVGVAEHLAGEGAAQWFARVDAALYAAKSAGRDRVVVDERGSSDAWARESGPGALRLEWSEAYECGEPGIDDEHRELFRRANALIALAFGPAQGRERLMAALDELLAHVANHFAHEEALLQARGYEHLEGHRQAHRTLLARAGELRAGVADGTARMGELVEYLAGDVVSRHLLTADRAFFPLFAAV